jgi:serine/threonine-protein kinase RsbW
MESPTDFSKNKYVLAVNSRQGDRVVRLRIPARAEYITLSRLALTGLARVRPFSDEVLADLKLAITEACSNSVRHAYEGGDGMVDIVYRLEYDRIEIEVADDGTGFDHEGSHRDDEEAELTEGGLGIAIIRSIADELEIGSGESGRGSRLRFVKSLEGLSSPPAA